ncbi:cytochrome o ubiquinol oxidase subunit IV [Sphingomonas sp. HT-1]|uniref:cytochrome o ubiquinol oxidase subunit IV n=1 Tax=unclassified Sphingomonas TaxID=196159 RepID=UPI0002D5ACD5|nr:MULTISPECIES: cytochrome o ubiquinol oxidase subunit IV [unclassified Sphingomonas]KTF67251.1 cytochrome C oxidase subunit III [Sphingomonas sp. WG]
MSADTHGHAGHHHDDHGAPHSTRGGYITGFLLSVVLTAIPFAIVMGGWIADTRLAVGICAALAVAQILVHMVYFLHMNSKSEQGWTMMALIFTVIIVVIALTGSLWVMYHMNLNMMPGMGSGSGM